MKKIKILTGLTIIALIVGVIVMNSCKKQESEIVQVESSITKADKVFVSKLVNFKQKVDYIKENPHFKSGETMEIDSVIWYLEALFNAVYAYPDEVYSRSVTDFTTLEVGLDASGFVSLNELSVKYDELYAVVREFYINSGIIDKGFVLLDLEINEIISDQAIISVRSVTGEKNSSSAGFEFFGENDWWLYGNLWGDCDYLNTGTDAAEKIEAAIRETKPYIITPPGYYWVYSDVDTVHRIGNEYMDENGKYLMFYMMKENGNFMHDDKCLEPDEMNFHYNGEFQVIYEILEPELGKRFMDCDLIGVIDTDYSSNPRIRHDNWLTFATPHLMDSGTSIIIKDYLDE
nr:hypothetical protein [Bacteroidota bacterium]